MCKLLILSMTYNRKGVKKTRVIIIPVWLRNRTRIVLYLPTVGGKHMCPYACKPVKTTGLITRGPYFLFCNLQDVLKRCNRLCVKTDS